MTPRTRVGNDVVDLRDPRLEGKTADRRFLERILDGTERRTLADASHPDIELWCLWAAKEAAFKVTSKVLGAPPPFEHRAFGARWIPGREEGRGQTVVRTGTVRYRETETGVVVLSHRGEALHAVAYTTGVQWGALAPGLALLDEPGAPWAGSLPTLEERLTPREADAVHSRPSAAVRLAARAALAEEMEVEEGRLEIVCAPGPSGRRPPRVFLDGAPTDADVSLSHAGRWIAWVVAGSASRV